MQLEYNLNPEAGYLGALAYIGMPTDILSCDNLANEVVFGRLVSKVSGSDLTIARFNSPNDTQYGIVMHDERVAIDEATTLTDAYPTYSKVGVMRSGYVWVEVDQAVTSDDDVYARHSSTLSVSTLVMSGAGSGDFVASNSIAITVNGAAITGSPLAFDTNNATTLSALATLLQATDSILTAVSDGSHTITITSVNSDMPVVNLTITGGATQATDTQTETVAGVEGDQGVFRKDADSNKASLVSGAKFITSADANGLAIIKVAF